jgi:hypothetical protein
MKNGRGLLWNVIGLVCCASFHTLNHQNSEMHLNLLLGLWYLTFSKLEKSDSMYQV